jgi:hypothetical protein
VFAAMPLNMAVEGVTYQERDAPLTHSDALQRFCGDDTHTQPAKPCEAL